MSPARFQTALRRRLRLPLPLIGRCCGDDATPGCRAVLDEYGDHLAACPRTGLLARRAGPFERVCTQVAREAGGRVVHKQLLRDTNITTVRSSDRRQLDMVAYGLTRSGAALCCDATLVSPLDRRGQPHSRAAEEDGVAPRVAKLRKRRTYPELASSWAGTLVVLACEVGGRWNQDTHRFVRRCAKVRAAAAPELLRSSAAAAWRQRWWGLLGMAVQDSLAATLARDGHLALGGYAADEEIPLGDVLVDAAGPGGPSRLPLRG